jgi:hypothetical protein
MRTLFLSITRVLIKLFSPNHECEQVCEIMLKKKNRFYAFLCLGIVLGIVSQRIPAIKSQTDKASNRIEWLASLYSFNG